MLGRFINADALVSTGQGLLGNNMFAYCGNNPVNFHDPTGLCKNTFSSYFKVDCGKSDCSTSSAWNKNEKKAGLTITRGKYVSVNLWVLNVTVSLDIAVDTQGNIQPLLSVTKDLNASGKLSASTGNTNGIYVVPDTSYLYKSTCNTYNLGGGYSAPIPELPLTISVAGSVIANTDGDIGVVVAYGPSSISASGPEYHVGIVDTYPLLPQVNIPHIIERIF